MIFYSTISYRINRYTNEKLIFGIVLINDDAVTIDITFKKRVKALKILLPKDEFLTVKKYINPERTTNDWTFMDIINNINWLSEQDKPYQDIFYSRVVVVDVPNTDENRQKIINKFER